MFDTHFTGALQFPDIVNYMTYPSTSTPSLIAFRKWNQITCLIRLKYSMN